MHGSRCPRCPGTLTLYSFERDRLRWSYRCYRCNGHWRRESGVPDLHFIPAGGIE
jgi:transposase-like protein